MTETIPPPDYTDALQDILVTQRKPGLTEDIEAQGERGEETTSMVEVPLDENDVSLTNTSKDTLTFSHSL